MASEEESVCFSANRRFTYKPNAGYRQSTDGMQQSAQPREVDVLRGYLKIPEKVSGSKSLYHTTCWCIAPESACPIHLMSLLILEYDPEGGSVDEEGLHHRNPVYVPVESCALIKALVCFRTDELRDGRRQAIEDKMVSEKAEENLVDMVWQCGQAQMLCERLAKLDEPRRRWDWIPHVRSQRVVDYEHGISAMQRDNLDRW